MAESKKQSDFGNIQREAMNRVRQMQQNTKQIPNNSEMHTEKKEQKHKETEKVKNDKPKQTVHDQPNKNMRPPDLMDIIMADKERSLIILLIILLTEEKADSGLILALMYLVI